jgi:hypothetical protein
MKVRRETTPTPAKRDPLGDVLKSRSFAHDDRP